MDPYLERVNTLKERMTGIIDKMECSGNEKKLAVIDLDETIELLFDAEEQWWDLDACIDERKDLESEVSNLENERDELLEHTSTSFDRLFVFAKFCWNVIDEQLFVEMMMGRYNDIDYIKSKWPSFKKEPMMFIVGRGEKELYQKILEKIKDTSYNG